MKVARFLLFAVVSGACGCDGNPSAAPTPATPSAAPVALRSNWQVDSQTNPVTGEIMTTASLSDGEEHSIIVRKRGKKLDCYINTDEFLETIDNMHSRTSSVQYRFDTGNVTRQTWTISDDNDALFYPGNPKAFLTQMRQAKSFSIEYKPADKISQTITFEVTGLPDVFGK